MGFFTSDDDDMPSPAIMVLALPVAIPALAIYGAYHGVKAIFVHGIKPAARAIANVSKKKA